MSELVVITDISIAADQFELGRLFEPYPDVEIEVERVIPTRRNLVPLFWVSGAPSAEVEELLAEAPLVEGVEVLTEADDRTLFRVDWSPTVDPFFDPLVESQGEVLRAKGGPDAWEFRVQFTDRAAFRTFREGCTDRDVDVELLRLYDPTPPDTEDTLLTDPQRDALVAAHDAGYWKVPRGTTVGELGGRLGISAQAVSERLRRGTDRLVDTYVASDAE